MTIVVHTDGGARGNPGPAGAGVVIEEDGRVLAEVKKYLGPHQTNNWAEYEAVYLALEELKSLHAESREIIFYLDSKLVVEQIKGNWKIKEPTLKPQVEKIRVMLRSFASVDFQHIPREENTVADRLVNEAIDSA